MNYSTSYREELKRILDFDSFYDAYNYYYKKFGNNIRDYNPNKLTYRMTIYDNNIQTIKFNKTLFNDPLNPQVSITPQTISYYNRHILHREDGPARYYFEGTYDWYFNGRWITYDMENYVNDIENISQQDLLLLKLVYL